MARDTLTARFEPDTDGTDKLLVTVQFRGFSGHSGAWFNVSELETFAEAISAFPIPNGPRPSIAGGFWKKETRGELEQEHLALTASPLGSRGQVGVLVRLTTELWEGDRPESQSAVSVEFLTTYQPLGEFAKELRDLVRGRRETAILESHVLS